MKVQNYIKKTNSKGEFILDEQGDFVMELISTVFIEEPILTDLEKKQLQYQELVVVLPMM